MKKLFSGLLVALSLVGCSKITDADVGIRQTFSGEIENKVLEQGIHQTVVGDVIKVSKRNLVITVNSQPIVVEKIPMGAFELKVNYGVVAANAAIAYKTEKAQHIVTEDGDVYLLGQYVQYVANSAVNDVVSKYKALEVNDNRAKIEVEIKDMINAKLKDQGKDKYVKVNEINILKVSPPASILKSSQDTVNSENALKTKQNELLVAKVEQEKMRILAQQADAQYVNLLRAEAEKVKADAMLKAAEKGSLVTYVVPETFTSIGSVGK